MKWTTKSRMLYLDFSPIASLLDILRALLTLKSLLCLAITISINLNVDFNKQSILLNVYIFIPSPGCPSEYSLCS